VGLLGKKWRREREKTNVGTCCLGGVSWLFWGMEMPGGGFGLTRSSIFREDGFEFGRHLVCEFEAQKTVSRFN